VDGIMARDPAGKELKAEWKPVRPDQVEVKLPLQGAAPGELTLLVSQYGAAAPQPVEVHAFAEAARLERFALHAGDVQGVLKGGRLDEVASLSLRNVTFLPGALTSAKGTDELAMSATDAPAAAALPADESARARVTLKDGRVLEIGAAIEAPRPRAALIGRSVQPGAGMGDSHIRLVSPDDLPQGAQLTFSVRSQIPARFGRDERIEVATQDGAYSTILSATAGTLTLGDAHVAVARIDPARDFGPAAFGPLQFRVIAGDTSGDWQPLAKLVRLPSLRELTCPASPELACKLTGTNLFLLQEVGGNPGLEHAVEVPDGFPGAALPVPHPTESTLYLRLRDDPTAVNMATLGARSPTSGSGDEQERAAARHAATIAPQGDAAGPPAQAPSPAAELRDRRPTPPAGSAAAAVPAAAAPAGPGDQT
jgi:hypothetical protein